MAYIDKKNDERYTDMTPYSALTNSTPNVGDVYLYTTNRYDERIVVVLAKKNKVCTVLQMIDEEREDTDVSIRGKHINTSMIQYCYENKLFNYNFKYKLTNNEVDKLLERVSDALGIKQKVVEVVKEVPSESKKAEMPENFEDILAMFDNDTVHAYCKVRAFMCACGGDLDGMREYMSILNVQFAS